jgi:cell division protein FtsW (lipid II flippase)
MEMDLALGFLMLAIAGFGLYTALDMSKTYAAPRPGEKESYKYILSLIWFVVMVLQFRNSEDLPLALYLAITGVIFLTSLTFAISGALLGNKSYCSKLKENKPS